MKELIQTDYSLKVKVLTKTERPNLISYLAMHQCYSESNVADEYTELSKLTEAELGKRVVEHCIKRGHYSVIEHPTITLNVINFPHSVVAQVTRHRHLSFSIQSMRYTGQKFIDIYQMIKQQRNAVTIDKSLDNLINKMIEQAVFLRPPGKYTDRKGHKYEYTVEQRWQDLLKLRDLIYLYGQRVSVENYSEEHARGLLPYDYRQDFVVTMNARSLLHLCDLRLPKDAQPEIQVLADYVFSIMESWMPEVADYYRNTRFAKNKLAP